MRGMLGHAIVGVCFGTIFKVQEMYSCRLFASRNTAISWCEHTHLGHSLLRILMLKLRLPPRVRLSRIPTATSRHLHLATALAMEVATSPGVTSRHQPLIQDAASRVLGARMGEGGSVAGNQSHRLQIFALSAKGVALHMDAWMVLFQRPSWQPFESMPTAMMLPVGAPRCRGFASRPSSSY